MAQGNADKLRDLASRVESLCHDEKSRSMFIHWSDAELLKRIASAIDGDTQKLYNTQQALTTALQFLKGNEL